MMKFSFSFWTWILFILRIQLQESLPTIDQSKLFSMKIETTQNHFWSCGKFPFTRVSFDEMMWHPFHVTLNLIFLMQSYCSTNQVTPQLANTLHRPFYCLRFKFLLNFVMTGNQKWVFWMDECLYVAEVVI